MTVRREYAGTRVPVTALELNDRIARCTSFNRLWVRDLPDDELHRIRTMLFKQPDRRQRFCQLAFTPVIQSLRFGSMYDSQLAMGRLLFGTVFDRYHPAVDESEWQWQMLIAFNETTQAIGRDEAGSLLVRFEKEMDLPTSLTFLKFKSDIEEKSS